MIEFFSYMLILAVCGYVAAPLFSKKEKTADHRTYDMFHQQRLIRETIRDLEFDFQTGKLSRKDYETLIAERKQAIQKADSVFGKTVGIKTAEIVNKLEVEIQKVKEKLEPSIELFCPHCGHAYKKGNKFCSKCGAKL